jgi:signal transduction histidine kinase
MTGLTTSTRSEPTLLRLLFNNLPNSAAALFDRDLRIVCAGGDLLPGIGITPEAEGRTVAELFDPERADMLTHWFMPALQGQTVVTTWPYADKLLNITVRPVINGAGAMPLGVVIVQDLKALTGAQADELREEHQRASVRKDLELMQTKARLIERILHEFRNPLASVASSADILTQYGDSMPAEKRHQHVTRISGEAHRLAEILDDILTLLA